MLKEAGSCLMEGDKTFLKRKGRKEREKENREGREGESRGEEGEGWGGEGRRRMGGEGRGKEKERNGVRWQRCESQLCHSLVVFTVNPGQGPLGAVAAVGVDSACCTGAFSKESSFH